MSNQWRRLQFFERVVLQDLETNENLNIFKDFKPTCSSSGYGYIAFGGANGAVRFMNRQHKIVEFQAYGKTVLDIKQLKRSNVIVTIGEDSNTDNDTSLKFWRVSESNSAESLPVCVKTVRLFSYGVAKTTTSVTCFAVLEDLSQVSVGFDDGSVMLVEATNIMRDRHFNISTIQNSTGNPITNLVYRDDNKLVILYIITATSTTLAYINKRNSSLNLIDDNMGAAPNCAMVAENETKHLYVCGSTIFTLDRDDRLSCYVNSGNVTNATLYHDYLVLVHADEDMTAVTSGIALSPKHTITVYDLKAKLIVFSMRLDPIFCCLTEWQSLLVVLQNGSIICLTDVPLSSKIAILFKRNLYNIAQSLASSYGTDPQVTAGITSHYAEHLYVRGDYEGAMLQFIDTIGYIEPSHVIRKFLDAQRIANLTVYLEQLHSKGFATADHTTLLLTCYTKLRYCDKLNKFVAQKSLFAAAGGVIYDPAYIRHLQRVHEMALPKSVLLMHSPYYTRNDAKGSGSGKSVGYDILSAIHSYRECSYLQHALFLALMFGAHHHYISLLLETGKHKEVLNYINSLPKHLAYFYILRHGSALLPYDRAGVTLLCIRLCTGAYEQNNTKHTVTLTPATGSAMSSGGSGNSGTGYGSSNGYGNYDSRGTERAPSVTVVIDNKGAVHIVSGIDGDGETVAVKTETKSTTTATLEPTAPAAAASSTSLTSSLVSAMEAFSLSRSANPAPAAATPAAADADKDKDSETLTLNDFADTNTTPSSQRMRSLASAQDPLASILLEARITPQGLFPIFSSDQPCFTVFLEALAAHDLTTGLVQTLGGNSVDIPEEHRVDPKHVWNALLEVYLQAATQGTSPKPGKKQIPQLVDSAFLNDVQVDSMDVTEPAPVVPPYTYQSPEILFGSAITDFRSDSGMSGAAESSDLSFATSAVDHGHKVLYLLKHYTSKLDVHHAVLLLEASGFHKGLECLHVTMNSSQELLVLAMGTGNHKAVMEACRNYGNQDESLWVAALVHFAALDPASDPLITSYLQECLEQVHKVGALSAINALQLVAANGDATLESIRGFLVRLLTKQTKQIEDDRAELQKYRADMDDMRGELNDLATKATIFKDVECHRCRAPLTLPTVHFMCLHSFHAQCAAEVESNAAIGAGVSADMEALNVENATETPQEEVYHHKSSLPLLTLGAIGVVFGDIGTSPLYALKEVFSHESHHYFEVTEMNVLGALSLITWSLLLVVTLKYVIIMLYADNNGEGGIFALMALILKRREIKHDFTAKLIMTIGVIGTALFFGDGMITPAISILSAVEGLKVLTPKLNDAVLPLTLVILVLLFSFQRYGTGAVGKFFGPIIVVWYTVIAMMGIPYIAKDPSILRAISPWYAIRVFIEQPLTSFYVLGAVVLVMTGGEAAYADMGHFGRKPIRIGWFGLALPALLVHYYGQGVLVLENPNFTDPPFFLMAPKGTTLPLVLLATMATVIASQALISGVFSVTKQAVQLGYLPRLRIEQTSKEDPGQIYVPLINWILFVCVAILILAFRSSTNLASAYGFAICAIMMLTNIFAFFAFEIESKVYRYALNTVLMVPFLVCGVFLAANCVKIPLNGWVPIVIAFVVSVIILIWIRGKAALTQYLAKQSMPLMEALSNAISDKTIVRIPGIAVYMSRDPTIAPMPFLLNLRHHKSMHQTLFFITIEFASVPFSKPEGRNTITELFPGIRQVIAKYGFMETPEVPTILKEVAAELDIVLEEKDNFVTYFVGNENIRCSRYEEPETPRKLWYIESAFYAWLHRNSQRHAEFFKMPAANAVEVGHEVPLY